MPDTDPTPPADVPAGSDDPPIYPVTLDDAPLSVPPQLAGKQFPRRAGHGRRGVLLVDRPACCVVLLDADDSARVFRVRDVRPLAGDPADLDPPADGSDHVVRAAIEDVYDVIAAPWAGDSDQADEHDDGDAGAEHGLGIARPDQGA